MTECEQRHGEDCCLATEDETTLPGFKVIDCINNGVVPFPPKAEYVALSYVWDQSTDRTGEDTSSVPTRMAISAPISRLHLPRTIQDAMEVVTKLGLRYLWVDKYCIDQTNVMELRHQISAMDKIYQNATVTVIAAAGTNSAYGLPGVRPGSRAPQPKLVINGTKYVSFSQYPCMCIGESVWSQRGWTLQEGYFSRRRLIFTDELVIFQCNQIGRLEISNLIPGVETVWDTCSSDNIWDWSAQLISRPLGVNRLLDNIQEYSKRELSHQSDGLNAIQGILSSYKAKHLFDLADGLDAVRFVHFWGVPITLAPYRDFFSSENKKDAKSMIQKLKTNQQFWVALAFGFGWGGIGGVRRVGFPSWSWAGWNGYCDWTPELRYSYSDRDLPVRIWVHTSSGNPEELDEHFVSKLIATRSHDAIPYSLRLGIETTLIQVKFSTIDFRNNRSTLSIALASISDGSILSPPKDYLVWDFVINPTIQKGDDLHSELLTRDVECAVMFGHYGLLLRTRGGVSERIGIIDSLDGDYRDSNGTLMATNEIPHEIRCLQNHFPTRKGVILLE
jgi:hypothetical protein